MALKYSRGLLHEFFVAIWYECNDFHRRLGIAWFVDFETVHLAVQSVQPLNFGSSTSDFETFAATMRFHLPAC